MKVTSVLEQGHVICISEIQVICKTEKRNFGKLYFRGKKKVKGNGFILPFDKIATKYKQKCFLRSNHQEMKNNDPQKEGSKRG